MILPLLFWANPAASAFLFGWKIAVAQFIFMSWLWYAIVDLNDNLLRIGEWLKQLDKK